MKKTLGIKLAERFYEDLGIIVDPNIHRTYAKHVQKDCGACSWTMDIVRWKSSDKMIDKKRISEIFSLREICGYMPATEILKAKELVYGLWYHDKSVIEVDEKILKTDNE